MTAEVIGIGGTRASGTAKTLKRAAAITREKRESTLRARCALVGISMHTSTDDHGREAFVLVRGALTKILSSLDAVEEFLDEGGAA